MAALVRVEICSPDEYRQSHPEFGTVGMVGIWVLHGFGFCTALGFPRIWVCTGLGFAQFGVFTGLGFAQQAGGFCTGDAGVSNSIWVFAHRVLGFAQV